MRRKAPPPPLEMPALLRCFDPAHWLDPSDPPADAAKLSRDRWSAAWMAWCVEHDVSPLDVLQQRCRDRLRAAGLPPVDLP